MPWRLPGPRLRRAVLAVVGAFGFLAIYFTGAFPPGANSNELSRFEMVVAMAEWRTFAIDRAIAQLGDHIDKSTSGGRYYSNKAPGLAFAAYPVYLALRLVLPAPAEGGSSAIFYGVRLLTVSLVSVIALSLLARRIAADAEDASVAPLIALVVGFATPMLFYARSFFSHAWTASLLFLAWELLRRGEEPDARESFWPGALSGFLAGWAAISEYTVLPIALFLAVRSAVGASRRRALEFVAGAAPALLLLLLYNAACFGSPFTLSAAREAAPQYAKLARHGLMGLGHPSPSIALAYLVHPARGILVFSPCLVWSAFGIARWWRSRENRSDCVLVLGTVLVFFVALSAYPFWHGGWALGNRYLLPALFFVAVPIGRSLQTPLSRGLFLTAAAFSIAQHFLLTATYPHFPLSVRWPAVTASLWFLKRGFVAPSIGSILGAGPIPALILPAVATLVATLSASRAARPLYPGIVVVLLAGMVPLAALIVWRPMLPWDGRLVRAEIIGSYSDRDPARRELLTVMSEASTPKEKHLAEQAWRDYGPEP